jgi:flavin-dependent dehydrogenase
MDKAVFPRDKVCAGWITPQVVEDLEIDLEDYRRQRTLQPITGFRVGVIGRDDVVEIGYDRPVSFGIRRCEFDNYLLRRSDARLLLGQPVSTIRRDELRWIINESVEANLLVGAGGHFCPVARTLGTRAQKAPVIAAQEVEFEIEPPLNTDEHGNGRDNAAFKVAAAVPELYFCPDFRGYGWCFRKQNHLNVGFGRIEAHALPRQTTEFVDFLKSTGRIPDAAGWRWRGHAYLLAGDTARNAIDDGVVLIGDAAGLAYPQSGEGIRPAIESGLMAARTILGAEGAYSRERLEPYEADLTKRFGESKLARMMTHVIPGGLSMAIARRMLGSPWLVRHLVIDRWFLHAQQPALIQS